MTSIQIPAGQDEQELLDLIHACGCYDGNKTRMYRAALREGLKKLVVKHGLSVMAANLPANELMAEAFAQKEAGEVRL
ncbi:hypothetical protein [Comamonas jiangduensis]|uniref:hypothetical protein n=1 Tax=Comamonas jiangduensis TaxID=1194168 RepID=UPI003BF906AD